MDLENMTYREKDELAYDRNTPKNVLRELARYYDWRIRAQVAKNPNTPEDTLRDLIKDEDWMVRCNIGKNPNASSKILIILFEHEKSLPSPDTSIIKILYANKKLPTFAKSVIETLFREMLT